MFHMIIIVVVALTSIISLGILQNLPNDFRRNTLIYLWAIKAALIGYLVYQAITRWQHGTTAP